MGDYEVAGYNVKNPETDQPYHPDAFLNPAEDFRHAGDPETQALYQEAIVPEGEVFKVGQNNYEGFQVADVSNKENAPVEPAADLGSTSKTSNETEPETRVVAGTIIESAEVEGVGTVEIQ